MILEIAVYSLEAAITAQKAGAGRIELCAAPAEGGLTPSAATLRLARKYLKIPIHVMIRPREGDFCYSDLEFNAMLLDIQAAKIAGMDGIVAGILSKDGTVDTGRMRVLAEAAAPMPVTFHRAFDMTCDLFDSLEKIVGCGIKRILTSGGRQTACEALPVIRRLAEAANGRISIMPGSGINEHNIREVIDRTGVSEIHLSAKMHIPGNMEYKNTAVAMGGNVIIPEYDLLLPDADAISRIRKLID
ncbi:MAG TPA: copper homeostasis protein CutC [Bacteroidales bacterium]|nr:copper homeostasis protein CutC [Bacteroidales bacterium]HPT01538.1 copper homeostasis protein CutC [Bacteroidales bacterium]